MPAKPWMAQRAVLGTSLQKKTCTRHFQRGEVNTRPTWLAKYSFIYSCNTRLRHPSSKPIYPSVDPHPHPHPNTSIVSQKPLAGYAKREHKTDGTRKPMTSACYIPTARPPPTAHQPPSSSDPPPKPQPAKSTNNKAQPPTRTVPPRPPRPRV